LSDFEYFKTHGNYEKYDFNTTDIVINGKKFYKNIWCLIYSDPFYDDP